MIDVAVVCSPNIRVSSGCSKRLFLLSMSSVVVMAELVMSSQNGNKLFSKQYNEWLRIFTY